MNREIKDLAARLERIENVLAKAAAGNFEGEIDIDIVRVDELTSLETGLNLLITDLADEVKRRKYLAAELKQIKKERMALTEGSDYES